MTDHGDENEIKAKKKRLSKIYEHFTGKTTISALEESDFPKLQEMILEELKILVDLKKYCVNQPQG